MAKYRNIEITIDEINEYKNNYELVVSNFLIKKEKINKLKEEFNIIKDLYNLEDDDFHYLNRIIIDKQNEHLKINSNLETTGITLEEYNYRVNNNRNNNCGYCILITIIFGVIFIIGSLYNKIRS